MAFVTEQPLPPGAADAAWWEVAAQAAAAHARAHGVPLSQLVWLLPFAALLPPARRAFAALGGWPPRIETTATLADQTAPPPVCPPGAYSGDVRRDGPEARARLMQTRWGHAWCRRDPGAFDAAVAAVLATARQLARQAATLAPAARPAWWQTVRDQLAPVSGPGQIEAQLVRLAVDWVAAHDAAPTDALFDLRPGAWVALQAGGPDPLTERLLATSPAPALRLVADTAVPWDALATLPALATFADAEAQAQSVAAAILRRLQADGAATAPAAPPIALVALERRVVRRIHALLARAGVTVQDDTGWRLPTTRAGARVMQALRAARARPDADGSHRDAWLAWLKDAPWPEPADVDALEARWRRRTISAARSARAEALAQQAQERLAPWHAQTERPLADWLGWLALLVPLTAPDGAASPHAQDPAARAVAQALAAPPGLTAPMRLADFIQWVDAALEQAVYVPPMAAPPQVVITPLARAMLRPFAAVFVPGADAQRLGATAPPDASLLTPAQTAALGLPTPEAQRQRAAWVLAQVLRHPQVALSWHRTEDSRPLADSPLLAALALARGALPAWHAALPTRTWEARPPAAPQPDTASAQWPASFSASALEAWRTCPYQFFAKTLLRLQDDPEFDADRSRADHGSWLHAALHHFHAHRSGADDEAELRAAAHRAQAELGLSDAALLPYRAAFETLLPRYLDWLHARDAQGWRWTGGELTRKASGLHGRIDRLDAGPAGRVQLLDYKRGRAQRFKDTLKQPLEDTQLMVYAALALAAGDAVPDGLAAAYLPLGEKAGVAELPNPAAAQALALWLPAVQAELARAQAGEPLRALGQGEACTRCLARGLCRRDAWADDVAPLPGSDA